MLRGWTVRQALRDLHMGGSTYTRYAKDYIWADEKFVRKLLLYHQLGLTEKKPLPLKPPPNPIEFKQKIERLKQLLLGYTT